jgi:hypothetical protein
MTAHGFARVLRASAFAILALLGSTHAALAQTSVSGAIANDTRWTQAQSPYLVTADVTLVANATLTIEPGVHVHFAPGRNLVVSAGALVAVGTAEAPIVFSSKSVLDGLPATRGEWGQVRFLDGNRDADTRLDHVVVEHGHGLDFVSGSARVDHATLRANAGTAIRLDLRSSPTGAGNLANDNDLDAIAVPAGTISGDVTWGLHGIPYLVATGTVEVGQAPALTSVSPQSAQVGEAVDVTLSGSRLTGLAGLAFDRPGVTATQTATPSPGSASVQFVIAEDAVPGPLKITAQTDAGEVSLDAAFSISPRQPKLVSIAPTQVYLGQGDSVIDIVGTALQSGTVAMLDATPLATTVLAPDHATAVVPSQATTGTRQVSLRTPDPATPESFFTTDPLPLQVLSPTLAVTPDVHNAQVGQTRTFKVVLPYPAPAGGLVVNLGTSNTGVATVDPSVNVLAGATEADFIVTAKALGTATVRATRSGYVQGSATIVVTLPPQLSFAPPVLNVAIGTTLPATLQLAPAPTVDTVVTLANGNAAIAGAPAQVTVPAGDASVTFPVDGIALGPAAVTASTAGYANTTLTVSVAPKAILLPSSAVVAPNATRSLSVALNAPAPAGGLVLSLASSNSAVLTVPASVTVAEGQSSATIAGIDGVANGTAVLSANASGFAPASTTFTVRTISVYISVGSNVPTGISVPVNVSISEAAPAGGIGIDLAIDDPTLASLSATHVDIPAGSTSSSFTRPQLTALGVGTVRITPTAPGLTTYYTNVTLIGPPVVSVAYPNYGVVPSVGKGLILTSAYVSLSYPAPTALTVTLANSQPTRVSVPATVTIAAGGTNAYFDVRGLEITQDTATITATAPGYESAATPMSIDVLPVQPRLYNQDTVRTLSSTQDQLYVELGTSRPTGQQLAAVPVTVGFSLATADPVGIVAGFTDGSATLKSEFVIGAGSYYTYAYVPTPTAVGTYSVKAEVAGGGSVVGPVTQVVKPKLYFGATTVKAVRGFKLYNSYNVTVQRETLGGTPALTVYLTSSDPTRLTVPATVTIPSGQSNVRFEIVGVEYTADGGPVTIDASAVGYDSPVEKLSATVIDPVFDLQLDSPLAIGQDRPYVYVNATNGDGDYVSALAPVDLGLAIVDADPADIISGIYGGSSGTTPITTRQIYAGGSGTSFYLGSPTQLGSFRVQVTPTGYPVVLSDTIQVKPGRLYFDMTRTPVIGKALQSSVCVYLQSEGGGYLYTQNPVVVTVASSDPGKVQAPAPFTIPAGRSGICDKLAGVELTNGTPVTVDASAPGWEPPLAKLSATVVPVDWKLWTTHSCSYWSCSSAASAYYMASPVYTGERYGPVIFSAFMNGAAANSNWGLAETSLPISLINETPVGSVPGFLAADGVSPTTGVNMAPGIVGSFYVGKATQPGSYKLGVQLPDGTIVPSTQVNVVQDALVIGYSNAPLQLGTGATRSVTIRRSASSVTGEIITAGCVDTTQCNVTPATAPTKYSSSGAYADFVLTGVGEGETLLSATLPGLPPAQVSVVTAKPIMQTFGLPASTTVGGTVNLLLALKTPDNTTLDTVADRTVTLTLSEPGIVSVPATVTYPRGSNNIWVEVKGLAKGTVNITISEPGSQSSSGSITVN